MSKDLHQYYENQVESALFKRNEAQKKYNFVAVIRIFFFVGAVVATVFVADKINIWLGIGAGFLLLTLFAYLIRYHQQIGWQKDYYTYYKNVCETEIFRLKGDYKKIQDTGEDFISTQHPYAYDLDLFGSTSLFTTLNRTATIKGKHLLVKWLSKKVEIPTIKRRQSAVKELAPLAELRQDFQSKGMFHKGSMEEISNLLKWVNTSASSLHTPFTKIIAWVLPILLLTGATTYFVLDNIPAIVIALPLTLNILALGNYRKTITALCEDTVKSARILKTYVALFKALEQAPLKSELLAKIQNKVNVDNEKASKAIQQLGQILFNLEVRENAYFAITINLVTLYEIHWALALEKWKVQHKNSLKDWFEALAEFDALQSIAGFTHLNPDFKHATFSETPYYYEAEQMGHPLIHREQRVCNNFKLEGQGKTILITGSNMSGKSTFLRTLGTNSVLAFTGAPVCALKFCLSPFQVFTSMRIQDSLEENTSAFYAELKRIQLLFKTIEQGEPVMFLLDEVLKGTNSKDRHLGVNAILKQLFEKNCFGLLSTHDLELNQLADQFPAHIKNKSFNSAIVNQQLHFDYQLHDGMCHSFSASKLMEGLGILGEGTVD